MAHSRDFSLYSEANPGDYPPRQLFGEYGLFIDGPAVQGYRHNSAELDLQL